MGTLRLAPASTAAFRHRAFALYWTAQLVSFMGTFMQQVALGYLVYNLTGSKWLLGLIAALQMGPSLFLALPAGVLADRMARRRLILGTQTTALLLAFSLASLIALHRLQVWEILVISTISGIAVAVESPARQAFVIDLVGREDLPNAIAWNSLVVNGARVIGPAIGGVAIRVAGIAPIFYFNSISFLAVIIALLLMRLPDTVVPTGRHPLAELREGLSYLRRNAAVIRILVLLTAIATTVMNYTVVMPILARDVLHTGADGLGWMWTALALGSLGGSITVVRWSHVAINGRLLLTSACGAGLATVGLAWSHSFMVLLPVLAIAGWCTTTFIACANSSIQHRVDDHVRGRVLSVYSMLFIGSGPVGGLLIAGLAGLGGITLALSTGGLLCLAATAGSTPGIIRHVIHPASAAAREARAQRAG